MEEKNRRLDEAALRRLLEREQTGPEALVLRLAWLEGLTREEIAALTWDQVDVQECVLRLPGRSVAMTSALRRILEEERLRRRLGGDPGISGRGGLRRMVEEGALVQPGQKYLLPEREKRKAE